MSLFVKPCVCFSKYVDGRNRGWRKEGGGRKPPVIKVTKVAVGRKEGGVVVAFEHYTSSSSTYKKEQTGKKITLLSLSSVAGATAMSSLENIRWEGLHAVVLESGGN